MLSHEVKNPGLFRKTINHVFSNYLKFSGRTPRRYFWMSALITYGILGFILLISMGMTFLGLDGEAFFSFFALIWIIFIIPIELGIRIRRLHDTGNSGWLLLLTLIPIVNFFFTLFYSFAPSEKQTNKYGDLVP